MITPLPPSPLPPIPDPEYHLSTLDNGLLVATFPMPWLHEVGMTLFVRGGSRFESAAESGVSHFLEHMIFKGTASIPDPTAYHTHLEAMAADMNAATGQESSAYWLSLPPEQVAHGVPAFCEMFLAPALSGIDTERKVILSEMREDENTEGEITNTSILGSGKLWSGHPLARPILGETATINRLGVAELKSFLARHYTGVNMALTFCGPLEHAHAVELARTTLGRLPQGKPTQSPPPPAMPRGPHWVAVDDQTTQYGLSLFFRVAGYQDDTAHALSALRRLLDDGFSSRLQAVVREKHGLVYDIWSTYTTFWDTGALELGAAVAPEQLEEVFTALFHELRLLRQEPPAAAEWQRVVVRWRAGLMTSLDHPAELVDRYVADRLFDAVEPLSASWAKVAAIDPQALPSLAQRCLGPDNLVVVLVGPEAKKTLPKLRQLLKRLPWSA